MGTIGFLAGVIKFASLWSEKKIGGSLLKDQKPMIAIKDKGEPIIYGILHMQGKDYPIRSWTWLAFMMRINEIMRDHEVEFPIGEDEEIRMVRQKTKNIERFRK